MKSDKTRDAAILLGLIFVFAVGFLLFTKGFLLTRIEVPNHSTCSSRHPSAKNPGTCSDYRRHFKHVVLLLIDALRYDFTVYDDSLDPSPPFYRNKLPYIRDLLQDQSAHAKLFRFVADPPTTTMQRLKAITTGGLPTFVDVSSNFNSYEILEDSLLMQAHAHGLNVTFMGDDTWEGLYGKLITNSFYYPSFNVKDLHTVDNGVLKHLIPEILAKNADVVIGHFLGVDHCGHIFGPSHSLMADKLKQMDNMLRDVLSVVDEDTIVFVFGDHGMTVTGDHGGESDSETGAALFVYSPKPIFCSQQAFQREISQIDLVPTVSLLLGIPIPFSSLGAVIPELFLDCDQHGVAHPSFKAAASENSVLNNIHSVFQNRTTLDLLIALQQNTLQIEQYLNIYSQLAGDFPEVEMHNLRKVLTNARLTHSTVKAYVEKTKYAKSLNKKLPEMSETMDRAVGLYYDYIENVKHMCRQIWAKFDDFSINAGISVALMGCVVTFVLNITTVHSDHRLARHVSYELVRSKHILLGVAAGFVCGLVCMLLRHNHLLTSQSNFSIPDCINMILSLGLFSALGIISGFLYSQWRTVLFMFSFFFLLFEYGYKFCETKKLKVLPLASILCLGCIGIMALYSIALLSNSYILYEFSVALFLLQTLLFLMVVSSIATVIYFDSRRNTNTTVPVELLKFLQQFKISVPHTVVKTYLLVTLTMTVTTRITKLFRSCRDLQVDCTLSHFTLSLPVAMEMLGSYGNYRLAFSFVSVMSVPCLSFWLLSRIHKLDPLQKTFLLPIQLLVSFLTCSHWLLQAADAGNYVHLTHFQHVVIPRLVYLVCGVGAVLFLTKGRYRGNTCDATNMQSVSINEASKFPVVKQQASAPVASGLGRLLHHGSPQHQSNSPIFTCKCGSTMASRFVDWGCMVLCVWQVLVILHNDGLACGACLMAHHTLLFITFAGLTSKLYASVGEACPLWPFTVYWCVLTTLYFHATGHEPTIPNIKFDAAFVGMHGEVDSFAMASSLVALNTLVSQVFFSLALPLLVFWVLLSSKSLPNRCSRTVLFEAILQLTFCFCIKAFALMLAASIHRRHLMIWNVFAPRFFYEGAFFAVSEVILFLVYLFAT